MARGGGAGDRYAIHARFVNAPARGATEVTATYNSLAFVAARAWGTALSELTDIWQQLAGCCDECGGHFV